MGTAVQIAPSFKRKREKLSLLLEQTAQAYRKTLTPLEARAYLESWDRLMNEVGEQRFERGLKNAISELQFFPKVDQISARVPTGMKLKGRAKPACALCEGTGWERVLKGQTVGTESKPEGSPVDHVIGAVRRCPCWTKVEVALIGENCERKQVTMAVSQIVGHDSLRRPSATLA